MKKIMLPIAVLILGLLLLASCGTSQKANTQDGIIENSSMETFDSVNPKMPKDWAHNSWGNNKATFSYVKKAHSGSRCVRIDVNNYQSGDAKWFFKPLWLPGGDYIFSDYYRSDVDTRVIVSITESEGTIKYIDLPLAPSNKKWSKYEASFSMPKSGGTVTIYHLLSQNGYLMCDDYSIKPYKYKGFNRGLVTITFDDSWEDNYLTALPIMKEFGYSSNQFYTTSFIKNPRIPNANELIREFVSNGHEFGSHTQTHPYLTSLTDEQLYYELSESKSYLENYLGTEINYFASPYGAYNEDVNKNIMEYYTLHRTVDVGYNSKDNFDLSRLKVQNILSTTSSMQVAHWVEKAEKEKLWLILVYHRVVKSPDMYDTSPEMFYAHMKEIKNSGVSVVTISQALAELKEQQE